MRNKYLAQARIKHAGHFTQIGTEAGQGVREALQFFDFGALHRHWQRVLHEEHLRANEECVSNVTATSLV